MRINKDGWSRIFGKKTQRLLAKKLKIVGNNELDI
jgi:hypothetical protein